jgi:hypothetical protein
MARRKLRPRDVPSARQTLRQMTPQNEENLPSAGAYDGHTA